eukprot:5698542-Amphidinium_carterae.1
MPPNTKGSLPSLPSNSNLMRILETYTLGQSLAVTMGMWQSQLWRNVIVRPDIRITQSGFGMERLAQFSEVMFVWHCTEWGTSSVAHLLCHPSMNVHAQKAGWQ